MQMSERDNQRKSKRKITLHSRVNFKKGSVTHRIRR
jgi:hypothetical protein